MSKEKRVSKLLLIIIIMLVVAILAVSVMLFRYGMGYKADRDAYEEIRKIAMERRDESGTDTINLDGLRAVNKDTVAWLEACGGEVSGPVVSSSDDEYYLHHRFDNEEAGCGTFFADRYTAPAFKGPMTIIYGHNMKDGSMFHKLVDYKDEGFFRSRDSFTVYTDKGAEEYKIFSVFYADYYDIPWISKRCLPDSNIREKCLNTDGQGGLSMAEYIKAVSDRSLYPTDMSGFEGREKEAKIAVLCTCEYTNANNRFVVFGIHV